MLHSNPIIKQTGILLSPDNSRVVLRRFSPHPEKRITSIINRVHTLPEDKVKINLDLLLSRFSERHLDLEKKLLDIFESIQVHYDTDYELSISRKLLIGAYFSNEYAFESAALFNPSIVPHPDQSNLPPDSLRFIMSLRAIGEGHISSLVFRTGIIDAAHNVSIDPIPHYAAVAPIKPDSSYDKECFKRKLTEMGFQNELSTTVLDLLPDFFTMDQLQTVLFNTIRQGHHYLENDLLIRDKILWLAYSNYEISIPTHQPLDYWVIFPASPTEKNGIEDVRFVRFVEDDGSPRYYATYTAYDGKVILPQLLETDFESFRMITLNGSAVLNKGMALFPRRFNGKFAMLSRQDNDSISLMYSDNIHFWHESSRIIKPKYAWEFFQIGNCGSPIETELGWLVLTHGVGPFREYSIGAILLDLNDPSRVIGRLKQPLMVPDDTFKGGYVPNVVYTCGCLIHLNKLILPYAISDLKTKIATLDLSHLLQLLTQ